ncbi:hypothetical protein BDZ89DRAFT_569075 [Hymenopellis radicata]|nr:hypothetical protein BDZ89DRAFT_569075 [Hymenopellis radicata]
MDTPSEFNCPALGCTAVLKIHEISGHRDSHVLPNGRVTVSNGSGGSKSIEADSFRKKVTDGAGCQHTCPYCNRSLTRCEQYHLRRHLVACQSLKQQAAKALEAFASRGN